MAAKSAIFAGMNFLASKNSNDYFAKKFYQLDQSNDSIFVLCNQCVKGFYCEVAMARR